MADLVGLFVNNLLPIILMAGAGFAVGRWLKINPRPVSQIIFNIFLPALIFKQITESRLRMDEILTMAIFTTVVIAGTGLLAWVGGKVLRLERSLLAGVLLTAVLMNAGNYGLPVTLFAFGQEAVAQATLFFLTSVVFLYTGGILIASMGASTLKESLVNLVRVPPMYGFALAVLFVLLDLKLPLPLTRTVDLLSAAAIPSLLVLLGLQLQVSDWRFDYRALALAGTVRLIVAPLIAIGMSLALNLQGPARQAGILEAGMPSAILATVLATEYNTCPSFVNTAVFVTTLLSPITITLLLAFLSA